MAAQVTLDHEVVGLGDVGNPDGFLTFSDALERSCNVYFENLAYRMTIAGLHKWFTAFGLGRLSGRTA